MIARFLVAILAIGLVVPAGVKGWQEYAAFQQLDRGQDEAMTALVRDPDSFRMVAAPSLVTQQAQMLACMDWQANALHARHFQPTRESLARSCKTRATEILRRSPSHAAAWLVVAHSEWHLGNAAAAQDAAATSRRAGANQVWLAARRTRLLLTMAFSDRVTADTRNAALAAATADARHMATSQGGADALARLYLSIPDAQDWIVETLEQSEDTQAQRRFLSRVRALSAERGA